VGIDHLSFMAGPLKPGNQPLGSFADYLAASAGAASVGAASAGAASAAGVAISGTGVAASSLEQAPKARANNAASKIERVMFQFLLSCKSRL
jgi:hypothetical protein